MENNDNHQDSFNACSQALVVLFKFEMAYAFEVVRSETKF
jgi:hypothetical protein